MLTWEEWVAVFMLTFKALSMLVLASMIGLLSSYTNVQDYTLQLKAAGRVKVLTAGSWSAKTDAIMMTGRLIGCDQETRSEPNSGTRS
jgi:hypothetical protein